MMDFMGFLAATGGNLGLFAGMSLLTLVQFLYTVIIAPFNICRKKKTGANGPNAPVPASMPASALSSKPPMMYEHLAPEGAAPPRKASPAGLPPFPNENMSDAYKRAFQKAFQPIRF